MILFISITNYFKSATLLLTSEARPEVKKFMTKVDKTETKYAYKNK
jgi:hypothetical protein